MNIVQNNDCIWIFDDPCHACHQDSFPLQQNISLHECQTTSQKDNQLGGCVWTDKQFLVRETNLVWLFIMFLDFSARVANNKEEEEKAILKLNYLFILGATKLRMHALTSLTMSMRIKKKQHSG